MKQIRLGAVGYLNARPLVYGLERVPRFALRYDLPSDCARLLHGAAIDIGLIPSIEYLRGGPYCIVPDLSIASRGPVASVALYTTRPMADVRSIAMDTSSRTSVALVRVLCARLFKIQPALESRGPDLEDMLAHCDAALIIGDNALLVDHATVRVPSAISPQPLIEKIDLGAVWTTMTGLPFVYAFWAGRPGAIDARGVEALTRARDAGIHEADAIARAYFPDSPARQAVGARYLRDNIKYYLRDEERTALEAFYRYAAESGVVPDAGRLRFF
ncbi:MAG: menaquinone biosynthesis protein [Acidobacteria bacterium]|nr:menaquinone biosynthesis protein [Acidobacteriota bacterium]